MKKCLQCGSENPTFSRYCKECGYELPTMTTEPEQKTDTNGEAELSSKKNVTLKEHLLTLLWSSLALIIGIGATLLSDNTIYTGAIVVGGVYFIVSLYKLLKFLFQSI